MPSIPAFDPVARTIWIDRFTKQLRKLNPGANQVFIANMADELWPGIGDLDPVDAAQATWEEWPVQED